MKYNNMENINPAEYSGKLNIQNKTSQINVHSDPTTVAKERQSFLSGAGIATCAVFSLPKLAVASAQKLGQIMTEL